MLKSFIDNFVDVYFHHYADFDGCLGRKQYWLAWLATVIIGLITGFIDGLLFWGLLPIFSTIAGCHARKWTTNTSVNTKAGCRGEP